VRAKAPPRLAAVLRQRGRPPTEFPPKVENSEKRRDRCPISSRWPRPTSWQTNVSGFYALSDTCTHRRGPLSEGTVEGAEVTCPWHGAKFDVRTGAVLGPPAGQAVKTYPVRVTGPDIEIEA